MNAKKGVRSFKTYLWFGTSVLLIIIGWIIIIIFQTPPYQEPDTSQWKTGDIFFSIGNSWKSIAVRALTGAREMGISDSTPSHCGIIIKEDDKIWLVHESTDKGKLVKENAEDYQHINGSYFLFAKSVPCKVDSVQLKKDVDYWLKREKPFDFDFDHSDSSAFYCTEFVIELMEKNGVGNFSNLRKNQYIYPKDLEKICINLRKSE